MNSDKIYRIPFVGLKIGIHNFEFEITDTFFDSIEYSIIHKGKVDVNLSLEKKETMLIGNYNISGSVEIDCNRCNDPVNADIDGTYQLIYKFDNVSSNDESLITIFPEEHEIDVKESILELITVSVPKRVVHSEGKCNKDTLAILDQYMMVEEIENDNEEVDTGEDDRWAELNKLKQE